MLASELYKSDNFAKWNLGPKWAQLSEKTPHAHIALLFWRIKNSTTEISARGNWTKPTWRKVSTFLAVLSIPTLCDYERSPEMMHCRGKGLKAVPAYKTII